MAGDSLGNWAGSLGRDILAARRARERSLANEIARAIVREIEAKEKRDLEAKKFDTVPLSVWPGPGW